MTSQPGLRLPVTGAFAAPFAAYYIFMSARVVVQRLKQRVAIGDRMPAPPSSSSTNPSSPTNPPPSTSPAAHVITATGIHTTHDPLHLATRAQQNFAEFVPLALALAGAAELNGGDPRVVGRALAALLAARVLHAELGIMAADAMGYGRPVGFYATLGVLGWLGGWGGWLVWGAWE
ncbi:membrane-associated, eicosanoid/glutathione metabolism protein [Annulohypoxylon bovei var. microspora]|nr:membrane-associated, eicosanoid/glutathione metabolism protein [Annulohypoxylon bovei var. microspora]